VVILSYDALARTKMNQEALLDYVKTVESLQRQVKLRQRNAAKKKADDLSERDKAILKHGVRAFVEEMLELPDGHKFDPGIAWDDIGIDMLIVDEAAAFKK
jgi:N12 class adenine-specific DNA methylase